MLSRWVGVKKMPPSCIACAVILISIITVFVLLKASGVIKFGNNGQ